MKNKGNNNSLNPMKPQIRIINETQAKIFHLESEIFITETMCTIDADLTSNAFYLMDDDCTQMNVFCISKDRNLIYAFQRLRCWLADRVTYKWHEYGPYALEGGCTPADIADVEVDDEYGRRQSYD